MSKLRRRRLGVRRGGDVGTRRRKPRLGGDEGGNEVALALGTGMGALVDLVGGAVTGAGVAGVFLKETDGVVVSIVVGASGDGGIDVENDLLLRSNPAISAPPPSSTNRRQWSSSPRTTAESPWLSRGRRSGGRLYLPPICSMSSPAPLCSVRHPCCVSFKKKLK
uniref:Uncharacterized protein n=1 Tax=Oryza sativa subsp. japonica TaxID=39947 RepID=Q5VPF8_ORYSJ|nr:hypothetical protein [Oryza sativa Japonica Group]